LRIGLPVFVVAFWIVCLAQPAGPLRVGLLIGAVVMSGLVVPVLILADFLRMWSEPDAAPEPIVLNIKREA
jgi:hypothetical protein